MSSSARGSAIGDRLRVARLDRRLSLEETAWRTRTRPDVLRALEQDAFDALGHDAFVRSHLTSYARFLGIDAGELVRMFEEAYGEAPSALEELDRAARRARKPPRARWLLASALSLLVLTGAAIGGLLGGQAERPPAGAEGDVQARIEVLADTRLRVTSDGVALVDAPVRAGQVRTVDASSVLEIVAADGDAIALTINGAAYPTADGAWRARFGPGATG